jgi:LAO/AO transport system kinase
VVVVPGMGDDIQAIKAGILEIADVFVVNKADVDGAQRTIGDLKGLQMLMSVMPDWLPPIVPTVAARGEGVGDLVREIDRHRQFLDQGQNLAARERERVAFVVTGLVRDACSRAVEGWLRRTATGQDMLTEVAARHVDPYAAAEQAMAATLAKTLPIV